MQLARNLITIASVSHRPVIFDWRLVWPVEDAGRHVVSGSKGHVLDRAGRQTYVNGWQYVVAPRRDMMLSAQLDSCRGAECDSSRRKRWYFRGPTGGDRENEGQEGIFEKKAARKIGAVY